MKSPQCVSKERNPNLLKTFTSGRCLWQENMRIAEASKHSDTTNKYTVIRIAVLNANIYCYLFEVTCLG